MSKPSTQEARHSKSSAAIYIDYIKKEGSQIKSQTIDHYLQESSEFEPGDRMNIAKAIIKKISSGVKDSQDIEESDSDVEDSSDIEEFDKKHSEAKELFKQLLNSFKYSDRDKKSESHVQETLELIKTWIHYDIGNMTLDEVVSSYGWQEPLIKTLIDEKKQYLERSAESGSSITFLSDESSQMYRESNAEELKDYLCREGGELEEVALRALEKFPPKELEHLSLLHSFNFRKESSRGRCRALMIKAIKSIALDPDIKFNSNDFTPSALDMLDDLSSASPDICDNIRSRLFISWKLTLQDNSRYGLNEAASSFGRCLKNSEGKDYKKQILAEAEQFLDHFLEQISTRGSLDDKISLDDVIMKIKSTINLQDIFPDKISKIIAIEAKHIEDFDVNAAQVSSLEHLLSIIDLYTKNLLLDKRPLEKVFTKFTEFSLSRDLYDSISEADISRVIALPSSYNHDRQKFYAAIKLCELGSQSDEQRKLLFANAINDIDDYETKSNFVALAIQSGIFVDSFDIEATKRTLAILFKINGPKIIEMANKIYGSNNSSELLRAQFLLSCLDGITISDMSAEAAEALKDNLASFTEDAMFTECISRIGQYFHLDMRQYSSFFKARAEKQFKTLFSIFDGNFISEADIIPAKLLEFRHNFMHYYNGDFSQNIPTIDALFYPGNLSIATIFQEFIKPESLEIIHEKISSALSKSALLKKTELLYISLAAKKPGISPYSLQNFASYIDNCIKTIHQYHSPKKLSDLNIDFSGSAADLFDKEQKAQTNALFKKILSTEEPNIEDVSSFFLKITMAEKDSQSLGLNEAKQAKMFEFFKHYKKPLALLLSRPNGIDDFCQKIATADSDGCFANIGSQLSNLFNSIFIQDPKILLLYRFFQERIVAKISRDGFDITHGHLFTHPALSYFTISVDGFIHELIQYIQTDSMNRFEFIRSCVGDDLARSLLATIPIQNAENQSLIEAELVVYFAMQGMRDIRLFTGYNRLETTCERLISVAAHINLNPMELATACADHMSSAQAGECAANAIATSKGYDEFLRNFSDQMNSSELSSAIQMMQKKLEAQLVKEEKLKAIKTSEKQAQEEARKARKTELEKLEAEKRKTGNETYDSQDAEYQESKRKKPDDGRSPAVSSPQASNLEPKDREKTMEQ